MNALFTALVAPNPGEVTEVIPSISGTSSMVRATMSFTYSSMYSKVAPSGPVVTILKKFLSSIGASSEGKLLKIKKVPAAATIMIMIATHLTSMNASSD